MERYNDLIARAEADCAPFFAAADALCLANTQRVLSAFWQHRVSDVHLAYTNGYGYDDPGRDTLDALFADVFGGEDALVRHTMTGGTHAISTALFALLRPGDVLLSVTGKPYDTLQGVIGGRVGEDYGALADFAVSYAEIPLLEDETAYLASVAAAVTAHKPKVVYLQRSRGYSDRKTLTIRQIEAIVHAVRGAGSDAVIFADNCYGEFCEDREPCHVGVSLAAGSLIKNPGGGLAPTGGYIVGDRALIKRCAARHNVPGIGKESGCSLGFNRLAYQGLFMAPAAVCAALKTAVFGARLFSLCGYAVDPLYNDPRSDIIQTITFHEEKPLLAFMEGIQSGAPINSFVTPIPWDMPGYDSPVVMAAGTFVQGASIELSADGKCTPPFRAFMQGGLTYESGRIGLCRALAGCLDVKS